MLCETIPGLLAIETPAEDTCVYWFDGPQPYHTSVAAIFRGDCCLIIDTYCGSDYMDAVRQDLERRFAPKHFAVLNTHHHWDHIWGNASFADCCIYGNSLCKMRIFLQWEKQLKENGEFLRGREEMVRPNISVNEPLELLPDIYALPTPGHTTDSLSVWDKRNGFLFAGDLVELPVVQLYERNLEIYQDTLERLSTLPAKAIFSGHCRRSDPAVLQETRAYLDALAKGKNLHFDDPTAQQTHMENVEKVYRRGR